MLVALNTAGNVVWQFQCKASNVTASVQSDHLLHGYTRPFFFVTDQPHRPPTFCCNLAHVSSQQAAAASRLHSGLVLAP